MSSRKEAISRARAHFDRAKEILKEEEGYTSDDLADLEFGFIPLKRAAEMIGDRLSMRHSLSKAGRAIERPMASAKALAKSAGSGLAHLPKYAADQAIVNPVNKREKQLLDTLNVTPTEEQQSKLDERYRKRDWAYRNEKLGKHVADHWKERSDSRADMEMDEQREKAKIEIERYEKELVELMDFVVEYQDNRATERMWTIIDKNHSIGGTGVRGQIKRSTSYTLGNRSNTEGLSDRKKELLDAAKNMFKMYHKCTSFNYERHDIVERLEDPEFSRAVEEFMKLHHTRVNTGEGLRLRSGDTGVSILRAIYQKQPRRYTWVYIKDNWNDKHLRSIELKHYQGKVTTESAQPVRM